MNIRYLKNLASKLALLALLALPGMASAQIYFTDTEVGDVDVGFRKTGGNAEPYEMVAYLGNITNFLAVPAGATINLTNYTASLLAQLCPNGLGNLQWSVFSTYDGNDTQTSFGLFPGDTCWYTYPRTNAAVQTVAPARISAGIIGALAGRIADVEDLGNYISMTFNNGATNSTNNTLVIFENVAKYDVLNSADYTLGYCIGDSLNAAQGDFNRVCFNYSVENVTSNNFTSPTVSDFYQSVPSSTATTGLYIDPITGLTNGASYNVGYFTLNPSGAMTFTRASTNTAPAAPVISSVTSSATAGFAPLKVAFTNTATGTITNYVWNFGNGTTITNTTGASVTNTYTNSGSYTVTLTVYGPGGSASQSLATSVVVSPTPKIATATLPASGKFVLTATNGPAGVQYRVLTSTNLTLAVTSWTPVLTNTIPGNGTFGYTNSAATNKTAFFILVSP